ncbi:MAG TPA: DUF2357 domain-containing protein, partial [Labilithrix sp.]|nr:DUF2357 domain-containing protein [Labilithrix sp.]
MSVLRLVRCGEGAPAEVIPGGHRLTAEADWLVEGPADAVAAVRDALPAGVAESWGSTLRLRFRGTLVGRIPAGPLGQLHVHSGKWTEADYDLMLGDIAQIAQSLPFDAGAASALPYYRDPSLLADDVSYHAFVWLRHALLDHPKRPLLGALQTIIAKPHRRLVREEREVPVELASAISARTLDDVFAGRWPLQRAPEGLGIRGHLPLRIADAGSRETVDTPENRFVKAFLEACDRLLAGMQSRVSHARGTLGPRLGADLAAVQAVLTPLRRAALFREVGTLTQMPAASTVLQRRAPYREVFRSHLLLRAASRVLPFSAPEIVQMLEIKNIARLYELWCGFHLVALLTESLGTPKQAVWTDGDAFGATVRHGLAVSWASGIAIAFNASYTRKKGFHGRSRSVTLRPDFALYLPYGPAPGLHLFDAKFRLEHNGAGEKSSRVDDIHKMHTYRDAIPAAKSAWVLYPGTHTLRYLD